ncbi:unnamed protein product [marine sediment metagenome]|uniref:DUF5678 domain-containing protein n=1 Tax=marine sediment metagenome TaxID=412755 RepID=X1D9Z1_9ZZZZ
MTEPVRKIELEEEHNFFLSKKCDWMSRYEGKYLLIKGQELIDYFVTFGDAYKNGLRRFGNTLFFIKKLVRFEHSESIPVLELGLINPPDFIEKFRERSKW